MRPSIIAAVLAAGVSMTAWAGGASAQGVGVDLYVGPPATYDPYYDSYRGYDYGYGPRVYGYYEEHSQRHLNQPEDYRTGSRRWWKQMERTGRSGHQE